MARRKLGRNAPRISCWPSVHGHTQQRIATITNMTITMTMTMKTMRNFNDSGDNDDNVYDDDDDDNEDFNHRSQ